MGNGKDVKVDAVQGANGNLRMIHGGAPAEVCDSMGSLFMAQKYLESIIYLCEDAEPNVHVIQDLIKHAANDSWNMCDDVIGNLRHAFPDDEDLKEYHYEAEEKERKEAEERKAREVEANDPIKKATGSYRGLTFFVDELSKNGFDVTRIIKDHIAGKADLPMEQYKASGEKAPVVSLARKGRKGNGKGSQTPDERRVAA